MDIYKVWYRNGNELEMRKRREGMKEGFVERYLEGAST
jgi:hypothetical protein